MKKIIRLNESDFTKLVKKIVNEVEEQQSCPIAVGRLVNQLVNKLSREEIKSVVSVYRQGGKTELENKIENILEDGGEISEEKKGGNFESAIRKIARIVSYGGMGFMGAATLSSVCLEPFTGEYSKIPEWFNDVTGYGTIVALPLTFAAVIVMLMTDRN